MLKFTIEHRDGLYQNTVVVKNNKYCITYYGCVFVALSIKHSLHTRHAVVCGLRL
jgi:hypothetical protein